MIFIVIVTCSKIKTNFYDNLLIMYTADIIVGLLFLHKTSNSAWDYNESILKTAFEFIMFDGGVFFNV